MIERLSIRNLILIEQADIYFDPGLNILTGETGSGKSAVLAAIRLIAGERADAAQVREGTKLAIVEASVRGHRVQVEGVDLPGLGSQITIRREVHGSGKSRCFVEDQQVSLQQLRQILMTSIELVDQSASHQMSDPEEQRRSLDAFLGLSVNPCEELFDQWRRAKETLLTLLSLQEEGGKESERMRADLEFLEEVDWQRGEEEKLAAEHSLLSHAQELLRKISEIAEFISEGEEAILPALKRFTHQFEQMKQVEPKLQECAQSLRTACVHLEDSSRFMVSYLDRLDADPQTLDAIEKRIAKIESVKRRFGKSQEEIDLLRAHLTKKLANIESLDEALKKAKQAVEEASFYLQSEGKILSEKRRSAAKELSQRILSELKTMNLPDAKFSIEISPKEISSNGADVIQWKFCANPGQVPLSLDACASGGELSRLLLALKITMGEKGKSSCLIFDEIDSNIGGKTATLLGKQLHFLSQSCQLICVTHFVQVAKYASCHFLVEKTKSAESAQTQIVKLDEIKRSLEYARMTGIE